MHKADVKINSLVFDLDGTAIPKRPDGMPSAEVILAVARAKQHCHVSVATGRTLELSAPILEALNIADLCILNGGSHLYSRQDGKFIWKQEVETQVLQQLLFLLKEFSHCSIADEKQPTPVPISQYRVTEPAALTVIFAVTQVEAAAILAEVQSLPTLKGIIVSSWTAGKFDVHISHELATKKHALESLLAYQKVGIENTMVVGDGANDIPLFELGGLRVAMGNADAELKSLADWVAPSVDENGLAVAIEKYILKP